MSANEKTDVFKSPSPTWFCVDGEEGEVCFLPRRSLVVLGEADGKLVILTACTYALSPQIPQNRKVIGGGHSIGQLWRYKKRQEVSEHR